MSSFVIGKEEYVKAAGIVAGLAEALQLWNFDQVKQRNMIASDYYDHFVECFDMNCISVQEQYTDYACYTDSNSYSSTFDKYVKAGKSIGYTKENLKETILELQQFFSSAMYQTEKESYGYKMQMFFDRILVGLMKYMLPGYEPKSWGSFEVTFSKSVRPMF